MVQHRKKVLAGNWWSRRCQKSHSLVLRVFGIANPARPVARVCSLIFLQVACSVLLLGSGCTRKPDSESLLAEIRTWDFEGADPRAHYPEIRRRYLEACASDKAGCTEIRAALVEWSYSWGSFEEAWDFFSLRNDPVGTAGKRLVLLRHARRTGAVGRDSAKSPDSEFVDQLLAAGRDESLKDRDVASLCRFDDVRLAAALSLAFLADKQYRAAMLVSQVALDAARKSLGGAPWDGVDHAKDVGPNVTADSIVLWRVYGACGLHFKVDDAGQDLRGADALAMSKSIYTSFYNRPDRTTRERAYLDAMYDLADRAAGSVNKPSLLPTGDRN